MVLEETATIKHALLRSNNFYEIYGGEDACCNIGGRLVIGVVPGGMDDSAIK